MAKCGLLVSLLVLSSLACLRAERINSISTKTSDCCLSRSLDSDGSIDWLPGAIDNFQGPNEILECSDYEIGAPPFTVTAFHDGSDGLTLDWIEINTIERTARCQIDVNLDSHSFFKAPCY